MRLFRGVVIGLLAFASLFAFASAASALTVSPSGSYTVTSGQTVLTFTSTGQRLTCTASRITGTISSDGSGSLPAGSMSFTSCNNGLLGNFTVTQTATATLRVVLAAGILLGLDVSIPAGGISLTGTGCSLTVGGSVRFGHLYSGATLPIVVATTDAFTNLSSTLTTTATTCGPALTIPGLGASYAASYTLNRAATVSG